MTTGHEPAEPGRRQEWPFGGLGYANQMASGWQPVPFRQFVLKLHSRCNLSCTYCYVYHQADQGWREQPLVMSRETVVTAAGRIAEHAEHHELPAVEVVFHGGEPLLAGVDLLEFVVGHVRRVVGTGTRVQFSLQTNGVLLDSGVLDRCLALGIRVGLSVDGGMPAHNRRRELHSGAAGHAQIRTGLALLASERFRPAFSGLLSVVDLASDPVEVYESLLVWRPPIVDFLLPHGNWTHRPAGRGVDEREAPYADWLGAVFDRWYSASQTETEIRLFQEIIALLLGGNSRLETVGLTPATVLVIETDGSIEQVDALKSAYHGAAATGLHVTRDDLDRAFRHPGIIARQIGAAALGTECSHCPVHTVCGGGYYPHRYSAGSGFRNRSVYCPDLFALITRIGSRIRTDLANAQQTG